VDRAAQAGGGRRARARRGAGVRAGAAELAAVGVRGAGMSSAMDELEDRVRRQLDRIRDLGDRMAAVQAQESSPGGEVTVVVDGNGALCDLRIGEGVRRLSPREFEQLVVDTAARAA